MNKLSTWLWFETQAEEAARFYASVFRGKVGEVVRAPAGAEPYNKEGQVLTAGFTVEGQEFYCLNGGKHPGGVPNDSVSHQILCADQKEVDEYWNKLLAAGGKESQCGWIVDPYGFCWQIVPEALYRYMNSGDREVAKRVTQAMFKMQKLDVAALDAAARG